jgi:hypothetical protein
MKKVGVTVATQQDVHTHLIENKWIEVEGEFDELTHVYKSTWNLPGDRSQVIWAVVNKTFFQLLSPFAKDTELSADRALNANPTLFGMGKYLGHYCLVNLGVVSQFSAAEFDVMGAIIATFADEIEKNSGGGDIL